MFSESHLVGSAIYKIAVLFLPKVSCIMLLKSGSCVLRVSFGWMVFIRLPFCFSLKSLILCF